MGDDMTVCHYVDFDLTDIHPIIGGGVETSIEHQRAALEAAGIDHTTDPSDDYDVLHLNTLGPKSLYRMFQAHRAGKKVVIHVHWTEREFRDSFRFSNLLSPVVDRYTTFAYGRADLLLPVSEFTRDFVRSKGIDVPAQVISNGIDGSALDGYDDLEGMDEKWDAGETTVVNLAAVFERKGLSDWLTVGEELSDTEFIWFGPRHSMLTPGTTKRKMDDAPANVRFPGYVDDKREAFAIGDIFFFPSHEEHQPLAILEALYCGMPLVVRDIPQYDWIEHGHDCLKGSDAEEFAEHIRRLKDDPELRERLSGNARATAQDHTLDHIGEELRDAYRTALDA